MDKPIKIEIRRENKAPRRFDVDPGIYTVGSEADCIIRLAHEDVQDRHAILSLRPDDMWVEDLYSPGGTYVDGGRVKGRAPFGPGRVIRVGPFDIVVLPERDTKPAAVAEAVSEPEAPVAEPQQAPPAPPAPAFPSADTREAGDTPDELGAAVRERLSVKQQVHRELVERLDIRRLSQSHVRREELQEKAYASIRDIVSEVSERLPDGISPEDLIKEVYDEAVRLGPLEDFLADPDITEIMVNGHRHVYVEKAGRIVRSPRTFMDDASVLAIIERIVSPIGRRIDESQPYVDARLPDGSRVNAIIHPLSLVGPCLTIRKFSKIPFTDKDLMGFGTMTPAIAQFARICVRLRKNIVVSGGTGSGKTTLLNVLSSYLPPTDRIVTIEDAAELRLPQEHVVRLEARPPNIEGKGAVTIRDLVRNALRMRPDRIVVGECRGGEALDMLQAMNTGHDGSLTTVHANSPRDVISRLETMVLMSGMDLPLRAIREQIAAAVDVIVHESRFSDGSRKVTRVSEIVGQEGDRVTMQDIFEFNQTGVDSEGRVLGAFKPTGAVPTFIEDVAARGLKINREIFDPQAADKSE